MYEKTNGFLLKDDSATKWEAAEKKVAENRKEAAKFKTPFRSWPASGGRAQNQNYSWAGKGIFPCISPISHPFFFTLFCLGGSLYQILLYSLEGSRKIGFLKEIPIFLTNDNECFRSLFTRNVNKQSHLAWYSHPPPPCFVALDTRCHDCGNIGHWKGDLRCPRRRITYPNRAYGAHTSGYVAPNNSTWCDTGGKGRLFARDSFKVSRCL